MTAVNYNILYRKLYNRKPREVQDKILYKRRPG